MVPKAGIEPARSCPHRILSPARLPVPPLRRVDKYLPYCTVGLNKIICIINIDNEQSYNIAKVLRSEGLEKRRSRKRKDSRSQGVKGSSGERQKIRRLEG